jgi:putative MFS transporter
LINFGLLLWLPANLVAKGYSMAVASQLLAASALIALATVFAAAFVYSRWSSMGALMAARANNIHHCKSIIRAFKTSAS